MLGTLAVLNSPMSAGCVATCAAPNAKPIRSATTASASGAFPPLAISAQIKPAITAVNRTTVNCITVHLVDAWYDAGLNDQFAPITEYTVMNATNCRTNITT